MTKKIRIENADTSTWKVRVHIEQLSNGVWLRTETRELNFPTSLEELYIHGTQRLVVEEGE